MERGEGERSGGGRERMGSGGRRVEVSCRATLSTTVTKRGA